MKIAVFGAGGVGGTSAGVWRVPAPTSTSSPGERTFGPSARRVFACAQPGMTAATRLPIGEIRATPESWQMFRQIVAEVTALAAAEGVALPADQVESTFTFAQTLEPGGFSSLYHDVVSGRRMEL